MPIKNRPWLATIHQKKLDRTTKLVSEAIAQLQLKGERISVASIVAASRKVDPNGLGISHTALLNNPHAREEYERHRNWKPHRTRKTRKLDESPFPVPVKLTRNRASARRRLLKLSKAELVDRLILLQCAYADAYKRIVDAEVSVFEKELS